MGNSCKGFCSFICDIGYDASLIRNNCIRIKPKFSPINRSTNRNYLIDFGIYTIDFVMMTSLKDILNEKCTIDSIKYALSEMTMSGYFTKDKIAISIQQNAIVLTKSIRRNLLLSNAKIYEIFENYAWQCMRIIRGAGMSPEKINTGAWIYE